MLVFQAPMQHREEAVENRESPFFSSVENRENGETLDLNAETADGTLLHVSYDIEKTQREFDFKQQQQQRTAAWLKKQIQTAESKIRSGSGNKLTHERNIQAWKQDLEKLN